MIRKHPLMKSSRDTLAHELRKYSGEKRRRTYRRMLALQRESGRWGWDKRLVWEKVAEGTIRFAIAGCKYRIVPSYIVALEFFNKMKRLHASRFAFTDNIGDLL